MKNYLIFSLLVIALSNHLFAQKKFHHPRVKVKSLKEQSSVQINNETKEQEQNMELSYPMFEARWEQEILEDGRQNEPVVMHQPKTLHTDLPIQKIHDNILNETEVKRIPVINPSLFSSLKEHNRLLSIKKTSLSSKAAVILAIVFFVLSLVFLVIALIYVGGSNLVGFIVFTILFLIFAGLAIMFAVGSGR
jgi:hypothetical protein